MVLLNRPHDGSIFQIAGDGRPAVPVVVAAEDVGCVVAGLVGVRDREHRRRIVLTRLDIVDEGALGNPRKGRGRGPAGASVGAEVDQPVVGAGVQGIFLQRALADRRDGRVPGHRPVVVQRVKLPHPAHVGQLVAVGVRGQVPADGTPGVPAIFAAPQALGREVEAARGVRADQDRGVPVPALRRISGLRLRLDLDGLLAPPVDPVQVPLLGHQIEDVRVRGIDLHPVSIGAHREIPVSVAHSLDVGGAGWSPQRSQVLRAAQDVEERLAVGEGDLVELRDGHVGEVAPGLSFVEGLVESGVGAAQHVARVVRIEPEGVVVGMLLAPGAQGGEGGPAVARDLEEYVHLNHQIGVRRGSFDLLIIVRARAPGDVGVAPLPALALVGGAIEAALVGAGFNGGVDDVRVRWRDREPDLAHVARRQPARHLSPALSAVGRLVDAGAGAARHEAPDVPAPLVGRGVDNVGVPGREFDVRGAGVLIEGEHLLPAAAAVRGPVDAALAAGRPQWPLGRDQHGVSVPGVDQYLADVLAGGKPHLLPRAAPVAAAVEPGPPPHVPAAHVLAGAHPDDLGVAGVEGDVADRIGGLVIEDRRPGGAGVAGLPHASGTHRDVPHGRVGRVDFDVGDATARNRRPDLP